MIIRHGIFIDLKTNFLSLENHVRKNRLELDRIEMPNKQKIWARIQKGLAVEHLTTDDKRLLTVARRRKFTLWSLGIAASLVLLFGVGLGYLMKPDAPPATEFNLANYAPGLERQEQSYQQLVASKMTELDLQNIDKEAFAEIFAELKQLDQEYDNWAEDVPQYIHEQELVDFLTRHYEQKIRILELLSKEIDKKANYEERAVSL